MVTAIVITKDEEKNIVNCLEGLNFADEIIVIDDNSKDRTVEIAKKLNATVFIHLLENNFAKQRNFALGKAKNEWVLFIDADEIVSPELASEILSFIKNPQGHEGAYIKRQDFIFGRALKHGETGNIKLIRLGKKDTGLWASPVHEEWLLKGNITTLKNTLIHYPHQTIAEFLKEVNYYTDIRAKELFNKGVKLKWRDLILYPKLKFFQNYFLKLGFLDGLPGFVFALMMSFHSFLVRGKLWQLNQKK